MISDSIKKLPGRAPHRSLLYSLGLTEEEMQKPFIGVVNSFNEIVPGHIHLRTITEAVKAGIRMAMNKCQMRPSSHCPAYVSSY